MCVLLVEDEPLISAIMAESLLDAGFEVIQASNGLDAMRIIADPQKPLSVLVTDVHLAEGMSGLDVAREVRARWPELPVIVATGRPDALSASSRRAFDYRLIRKPYGPTELVRTIREMLGEKSPPAP